MKFANCWGYLPQKVCLSGGDRNLVIREFKICAVAGGPGFQGCLSRRNDGGGGHFCSGAALQTRKGLVPLDTCSSTVTAASSAVILEVRTIPTNTSTALYILLKKIQNDQRAMKIG
jgi:hypothetical protein